MISEHAFDILTAAEQALASIPLPTATNELPRGAKPIRWEELDGNPATTQTDVPNVRSDKTLDLRIELGRTHMHRNEILKLRTGSVVPVDSAAGDLVNFYANGQWIARGEVLALDGNLAVRVVELLNQRG